MELRGTKNLIPRPSITDISDKYGRIMDKGNQFVYQKHMIRQEEELFRTQSYDKFEKVQNSDSLPARGNLFIAGSSAPVLAIKERKMAPKKYRAPLPKTRRGRIPKGGIPPLQGFGCTNIR